MKIKFDTDDNLPLNQQLKLHMLAIIVKSVFEDDGKFYRQLYLVDCLYEIWEGCSTKKLIFQKELALIKQLHQKNVCFVIIGTKDVVFKLEPHVCNIYHDVLMTAYELKNIAILNVKGVDFRCIF